MDLLETSFTEVPEMFVEGGRVTLGGEGLLSVPALTLTGGAVLTTQQKLSGEPVPLQVVAQTVTVDEDSAIHADGKGYWGGWNGVNLSQDGRTYHPDHPEGTTEGGSCGESGGSYGGLGGGTQPNPLYGAPEVPDKPGSGGGAEGALDKGGHGGGVVQIVAQTVRVYGRISADGDWSATHAGGGSGGAVSVTATVLLEGTGKISAGGGSASHELGQGGSGGRVKASAAAQTLPSANVTARAGKKVELQGDGSYVERPDQGETPAQDGTVVSE